MWIDGCAHSHSHSVRWSFLLYVQNCSSSLLCVSWQWQLMGIYLTKSCWMEGITITTTITYRINKKDDQTMHPLFTIKYKMHAYMLHIYLDMTMWWSYSWDQVNQKIIKANMNSFHHCNSCYSVLLDFSGLIVMDEFLRAKKVLRYDIIFWSSWWCKKRRKKHKRRWMWIGF